MYELGKKYAFKTWHAVAAIILVLLLLTGSYYNRLIRLDQGVQESWAQVENQYQRRLDLVPNLVNAVKGFFKQEQAIFDKITQAREAFAGAKTINDQVKAANDVENFLRQLFALVESNPQIRSNENVIALQTQLEGTENRVSVERRRYNETIRTYNTATKTFPGNLFARLFGFGGQEFFEAVEGAEQAPAVEL